MVSEKIIPFLKDMERLKKVKKENQELRERHEFLLKLTENTVDAAVFNERTPVAKDESSLKREKLKGVGDIMSLCTEVDQLEIENEQLRNTNESLHLFTYNHPFDAAVTNKATTELKDESVISSSNIWFPQRSVRRTHGDIGTIGTKLPKELPQISSSYLTAIPEKKNERDRVAIYGARGPMLGSGGYSDEGSSRRQPNPYSAVNSYGYGSGSQLSGLPAVRLRGLPFNCSETDIVKFFAGLEIIDILLLNKKGRFSGEAFVVFTTQLQVEYALCRDKQDMGRRYIEVFRCEKKEYYDAVASEVEDGGKFDNNPEKMDMEFSEVLRLRGLPFTVKKKDIIEFFGDFEVAEDKIQIVCRIDGKITGEAFVQFVSAEVAKRAMCKDRKTIGSRYVELFPSTPDEARHAVSKYRQ